MTEERLAGYHANRDTKRSGEPRDGQKTSDKATFVVQRHDTSTLHFDFRLQIGDVLASWAVPKGPSLDPRDKRLATRTEDHPLEYANFEGAIPEGQYGAGTVIIWDTGTFVNRTKRNGKPVTVNEGLANGHLKFELKGCKLTGGFALTHTTMGGDERNWMLVKIKDQTADRRRNPTSTQNESVRTGRTNEELAE